MAVRDIYEAAEKHSATLAMYVEHLARRLGGREDDHSWAGETEDLQNWAGRRR